MRFSSITTPKLVDEFRHVGRKIGRKAQRFPGCGVNEAQLGGVQRLPGKAESFKHRSERFGSASIDRVSQ